MKILSWDVGIINLAYCIMEENTDNDIPYKIHKWNTINLLNESRLKCNSCPKDALYSCTINNCIYGFCVLHKSQYKKIIEEYKPKQYYQNKDNDIKCNTFMIQKKNICGKKALWYTLNGEENMLGLCTLHKNAEEKKETNNITLEKVKKLPANKAPIDTLKENMIRILDNIPEFLDVNVVLIENQPSLKNPKMKGIADTLYSWFLIRGIIDKDINNSKINKLTFFSPSNKLKVEENNTIKILSKSKDNTEKYKLTKSLAITYCKQLIKNDNENLKFLLSQKKKDDLCDAFLQGSYYISVQKRKI